MLKFPALRRRPYQHILPPYVKYIVISTIIIFAAISSYLPLPTLEITNDNYRDINAFTSPKKVEALSARRTKPIRESVSIKRRSSTTVLGVTPVVAKRSTPTPTPTPEKKSHPTPTNGVQRAVSTPAPTPNNVTTPVAVPSGSRQELFAALNAYRQKKGKSPLAWDDTLATFAQSRAEKFAADGKMDSHAGFREMMDNDGFNKMGFMSLAENSSYGDNRDSVFIIETLYGQSSGHDANQLSSEYSHVGVGASGKATDFVFGGRKK